MNGFWKCVVGFILGVVTIVVANMTYDYIKVCYWGDIVNQAIENANTNTK